MLLIAEKDLSLMKEQEIYKPTAADRRRCSKCKYRTYISGLTCCLYVLDTGKPRGCQFGVKCDKFEKGKPDARNRIFSVIDPDARVKYKEDVMKKNDMIAYKGDALKRMRIKER